MNTKELSALFLLIDDPDEDVYNAVSEKIVSLGKEIIPNLEHLWETMSDEDTQDRIEMLIHGLHLRELTEEFTEWKNGSAGLLAGALLIAKYHYPELEPEQVLKEIEKLRRNIWLELNSYLTPIEKINVLNSIFYNYYKHKGVEISYDSPDTFLINKTLESKKGNAISNGIIYLILCEQLDIPVKAINIPRQFILGFFDQQYAALNPVGHSSEKINFYLDPLSGQMYSHKDIENYFKKLSVPPVNSYFKPINNKRVVQFLIEEISKCYDNDRDQYKVKELLTFASLLDQ
ncbi:MAG: transglutaminase-like domain-containing protein [Ferruginibacter sp.]